jgi:hypothetical protein
MLTTTTESVTGEAGPDLARALERRFAAALLATGDSETWRVILDLVGAAG